MSYINDITTALTTVIDHACGETLERFAGYEVNRKFWVDEAIHCLEVIDGYPRRFERMRIASKRAFGVKNEFLMPFRDPNLRPGDLDAAKQKLLTAMSHFLHRCLKERPGDLRPILQSFSHLGLPEPK